MNPSESGIFVLRTEPAVYVRVIGRGSFQNSRPLRCFAAGLIENPNAMIKRMNEMLERVVAGKA